MNTVTRWAALVALASAVLVIGLDLTVLNVALPTLAEELNASTAQLQWVVDAYVLAFAGAMLPAGWLGDRFGRSRVLLIGLGGFGVASVAAAYAASPSALVAARVGMGLAAAMVMPLAMALVPALFDREQRQRAVTVMVAAVGLGLPLGPVLAGVLLSRYWWGSVFLVTVPVVVASLVACATLLPHTRVDTPPRPDLAGGAAAVLGIFALTYGLVEAPSWGWASPRTATCLVVVLSAFAVAGWRQRVAGTPMVPRDLLANATFVRGTAITGVVTFVMTGVLFLVPMYLQLVVGHDPMGTGMRLAPFMLSLVVGGALADRAAQGVALTVPVAAGLGALTLGTLLLGGVGAVPTGASVMIGLSVAGFGVGLAMAPTLDRVLGALSPAAEGVGSAVNNTVRQVASALGVALLGTLTASLYEHGTLTAIRGLPGPMAEAVRGSLAAAHDVAVSLAPQAGAELTAAADTAFVDGLQVAMIVCAAVCATTVALTPWLLSTRSLAQATRPDSTRAARTADAEPFPPGQASRLVSHASTTHAGGRTPPDPTPVPMSATRPDPTGPAPAYFDLKERA